MDLLDLFTYLNALPEWILIGIITFVSLMVSSFLNVVIVRAPENGALSFFSAVEEELGDSALAKSKIEELAVFNSARSICPSCKCQLRWFHNIPVLSYVFLLGKCGFCDKKISIQYPLVELLTTTFSVLSFVFLFECQFSYIYVLYTLSMYVAIVISVIDIKTKSIYDSHNGFYVVLSMLLLCIMTGVDMSDTLIRSLSFVLLFLATTHLWTCISRGFGGESVAIGLGDIPLVLITAMLMSQLTVVIHSNLIIAMMGVIMIVFLGTFALRKVITCEYSREVPAAPAILAGNFFVLSYLVMSGVG